MQGQSVSSLNFNASNKRMHCTEDILEVFRETKCTTRPSAHSFDKDRVKELSRPEYAMFLCTSDEQELGKLFVV